MQRLGENSTLLSNALINLGVERSKADIDDVHRYQNAV